MPAEGVKRDGIGQEWVEQTGDGAGWKADRSWKGGGLVGSSAAKS